MSKEPDGWDVASGAEPDEIGLVRSNVKVPEARCCSRIAFLAEEPGLVVPKAQIIACIVSELGSRQILVSQIVVL
jgi:hypothetical protein